MRRFTDRVAVITGGASGIGRAIAVRAAREEMRMVLADVEEDALHQVAHSLRQSGASVLPVVTDVSRREDVEALAQQTLNAYGAVHLLVNNAGVAHGAGTVWETSLADWEWVIGVNLWGVIHGVRTFVPIMLAQDTECHIVNTASAAGLVCPLDAGPYAVSKFGVVALSETLYQNFAATGAKVKVSVLCPGMVRTAIVDSERNRPPGLDGPTPKMPTRSPEEDDARWQQIDAGFSRYGGVVSADHVVELLFEGIRDERLYILTHKDAIKREIRSRMESIVNERNPEVLRNRKSPQSDEPPRET